MSQKNTRALLSVRARRALVVALPEMLAYQAAMNSKTAFYHYSLDPRDLDSAVQRGLMAVRRPGQGRVVVRLTKRGRDVARKLRDSQ